MELTTVWFILIYPGMLLMFHLQERSAARTNGPAGKS